MDGWSTELFVKKIIPIVLDTVKSVTTCKSIIVFDRTCFKTISTYSILKSFDLSNSPPIVIDTFGFHILFRKYFIRSKYNINYKNGYTEIWRNMRVNKYLTFSDLEP